MTEKKVKKVCRCENCNNEAEMIVTCSLESVESEEKKAEAPMVGQKSESQPASKRVKGHAVCTHCGNEADMWIDL
jgi:hypothetical protein